MMNSLHSVSISALPAGVPATAEEVNTTLEAIMHHLSDPDFRKGFAWGSEAAEGLLEDGTLSMTRQGVRRFLRSELAPPSRQEEACYAMLHLPPPPLSRTLGFLAGVLTAAAAFPEQEHEAAHA